MNSTVFIRMGRHRSRISLVILFAGLFFLSSCRQLPNRDDIPIVRRPNWWNFYNRGVAYSLKNDWAKASSDFETAIGKRAGAIYPETSEKRRAKTYGLHFLNDYFPHRELGICYFYMGRLDDAAGELNQSLRSLPSSRAVYYLNEVTRATIDRMPDRVLKPIRFDLTIPPANAYINRPYWDLKGTVASPYQVAKVTVNKRRLFIERAEKSYDLQTRIRLKPGRQKIDIFAEDLSGYSDTRSADVIVDLQGPTISITPGDSSSGYEATFTIADNHELEGIEIDKQKMAFPPGEKQYTRTVSLKPNRRITIVALDRAGNKTHFASLTGELLRASVQTLKHYPDNRLAVADYNRNSMYPKDGATNLPRVASDVAAIGPSSGLPKKVKDSLPPRLQVFPALGAASSVTTEIYVLDLQAVDSGYLDSIVFKVNGRMETHKLREQNRVQHRLTQILELNPGENHLQLIVRDRAGNEKMQSFVITRKVDYRWREDLRVTTQIMPPDTTDFAEIRDIDIYSTLLNALLQRPRRLNVVERDPETMHRILMELKLIGSKLSDQVRAVRTGKLKPADWIIRQYINRWSGKNNWDLVVNIVDVQTSKYLFTTDIHFSGFEMEHVRIQLQSLVDKLRQQLPMVSARVDGKLARGVKVPLGRNYNIFEGMRFVFISGTGDDLDFADPVYLEDKWVQGTVSIVKESECLIELFPKEGKELININDLAVIR